MAKFKIRRDQTCFQRLAHRAGNRLQKSMQRPFFSQSPNRVGLSSLGSGSGFRGCEDGSGAASPASPAFAASRVFPAAGAARVAWAGSESGSVSEGSAARFAPDIHGLVFMAATMPVLFDPVKAGL